MAREQQTRPGGQGLARQGRVWSFSQWSPEGMWGQSMAWLSPCTSHPWVCLWRGRHMALGIQITVASHEALYP